MSPFEQIQGLFPRRPFFWLLFAIAFTLAMVNYYLVSPYSLLAQFYLNMWSENQQSGTTKDQLHYTISVPHYVADFKKMPLRVMVTNMKPYDPANETENMTGVDVRYRVQVVNHNPNQKDLPLLWVGDQVQNYGEYVNLTPGTTYVQEFQFNVPNGSDVAKGETPHSYCINIYQEGEGKIDLGKITDPVFIRSEVLRYWAVEYLILPPSSNVVLLFYVLVVVAFGEHIFVWGSQKPDYVLISRRTDSDTYRPYAWVFWLLLFCLCGVLIYFVPWLPIKEIIDPKIGKELIKVIIIPSILYWAGSGIFGILWRLCIGKPISGEEKHADKLARTTTEVPAGGSPKRSVS